MAKGTERPPVSLALQPGCAMSAGLARRLAKRARGLRSAARCSMVAAGRVQEHGWASDGGVESQKRRAAGGVSGLDAECSQHFEGQGSPPNTGEDAFSGAGVWGWGWGGQAAVGWCKGMRALPVLLPQPRRLPANWHVCSGRPTSWYLGRFLDPQDAQERMTILQCV